MKPVLPFFGVIAMGAYLLYYHANSGGGTGKFLAGTAPATGFVFHYAMIALLLASVLISLRKINGIPELAEALHQTHWWFYIFFLYSWPVLSWIISYSGRCTVNRPCHDHEYPRAGGNSDFIRSFSKESYLDGAYSGDRFYGDYDLPVGAREPSNKFVIVIEVCGLVIVTERGRKPTKKPSASRNFPATREFSLIHQNKSAMIASYLKSAARNAKKHRFYTFINMLCLGIGLAASILATMFILDEHTFDRFHSKGDRIFRLNKVNTEPDGGTSLTAESSGLMGPTMVTEFPEVENCVRYQPWFNAIVLTYEDKNVNLQSQQMVYVDSSFFSVFDFTLLKGDPKTVLQKSGSVVLTPGIARALFGEADPVGKIVRGPQNIDLVVTGIVAEAPRNSHIQYSALVSWATTDPQTGAIPMAFLNNWIAQALCTYILLREPADESKVEAKLGKFMADHIPTRVDKYSLYLQPLADLYLHSDKIQALRMQKTGSAQFNKFFAIIAGFILFLACVNYINISTSRATRRGREVAMRKTLGARRKQLVTQFLGESFLMVIMSSVVAIAFVYLAVPYFNELTGKTLTFATLGSPAVLSGIAIVIAVVTIASGVYPALVLSGFAPAVIQGSQQLRLTGHLPRQILIVFQFVITITMITGTIFIYQQIQLVLSADMGFDKEHVLVANMPGDVMQNRELLRNAVEPLPNVVSTSTSQTALGLGTFSTYVIPEGFNADEIETRVFLVDGNYAQTYGLSMAQGRFFNPALSSDSSAVIINEAMLKKLSWTDAADKTMKFSEDGPAAPIIGVLKDFNFNSFYQAIEPVVMVIGAQNQRNLAVRFNGDPSNIIAALEKTWKTVEMRYPFTYFFVDDQFAKAYAAEQKLLKTVMTFAVMSIIIACLGLYGLVAFTIEQRTREFGIRKVFGATVANLNYLINKKFIWLVIAGGALSIPLVIPLLKTWLQKFTLQVEFSPLVFVFAFAITLLVTVVAVSVQAVRAGLTNPVKALRHS